MESGATAWSASAQTVLPLGGREGLGASEQADEHLAFACEFHDANEMPLWEARGQLGWAEARSPPEVTQPPRGGYDWRVCILADWDELRRRVEDAVESEDLRTLISETAARVETLIDEISVWTCAPENAEWVRRCQRRPRAEWVV